MALLSGYSMVDPSTRSLPSSLPERCRAYRKGRALGSGCGILPQRVHGLQRRDWIFKALEIYRDGVKTLPPPSASQASCNSHNRFPRVVERPEGKTEEMRGIDI